MADQVVYRSNVTGPVESVGGIDPITNEKEIVVLGQIVVVNFITKFKPDTFDFDSIAANDVVEVSGYLDDTGAIRATFIEKIGDAATILDYEVTGFVESLNPDLKTFMINVLKVDYSAIANNLPQGIPADDLFVEVEGRLAAGGEMLATKIELGDELGGEDGDEFTVGDQVVQTDEDTVFDPWDLEIREGIKLEVKGVPQDIDHSILAADKVSFETD